MEIIIWVVVGIIYAIAESGGRTGRMSVDRYLSDYGRLGFMDLQDDFSLEFNPLEEIRQTYNENLKTYYKYNQPKTYLINNDCEARLVKERDGSIWFYVKERTNGKTPGKYFEVYGDDAHAGTMWAIIDMEFNQQTRYADIKALYYKLNKHFETIGGLRYFHEPLRSKLPKSDIAKSAQNEYCRMEMQNLPNGDKVIVCSEIWPSSNYNQPRRFLILADIFVLYDILSIFSKNDNKMLNYIDLLYQYVNRTDCTVKELNQDMEPVQNTNSAKKLLEDIEQRDNKSTKKSVHKKEELTEKLEELIEQEKQKIEKYNERNLDL